MEKSSRKSFLSLLILILIFEGVSAIIGISTAPGDSPWYAGLAKSPLNPPSYLFGIMWPSLYLLIAIATWLAWNAHNPQKDRFVFILFGAHMLMNWSWNFVFFEFQKIDAAFFLLLAIVTTLLPIIFYYYKIRKTAGILLIPYFVWVCFASYLSGYIFFMNT